eukprot:Colp12_sorted_trinity150504_noHs@30020
MLQDYVEAERAFAKGLEVDPTNALCNAGISACKNPQVFAGSLGFDASKHKITRLTDHFECALCLKLFYKPVTTVCGHTFCKACLLRAVENDLPEPKCPLCRKPVEHMQLMVNVTLQNIIQASFPEEHNERCEEDERENSMSKDHMPLFLLDCVALPGMQFPLHIFEPRYRLMLRRCLAGSRRFGLVPVFRSVMGQCAMSDVGCTLEITAHNQLPDGRSHINTVGGRRFRILDHWETDGYAMGKIEYFDDDDVVNSEYNEELECLHMQTRDLITQYVERLRKSSCRGAANLLSICSDMPKEEDGPQKLSFWIANVLPMPDNIKRELLRMTSCKERLRIEHEYLAGARPHSDQCSIM